MGQADSGTWTFSMLRLADMHQGGEHMEFASLSRLGRNGEYLLFWGSLGEGSLVGKPIHTLYWNRRTSHSVKTSEETTGLCPTPCPCVIFHKSSEKENAEAPDRACQEEWPCLYSNYLTACSPPLRTSVLSLERSGNSTTFLLSYWLNDPVLLSASGHPQTNHMRALWVPPSSNLKFISFQAVWGKCQLQLWMCFNLPSR